MAVVFDANFLVPLLDSAVKVEKQISQKLNYLVIQLQRDNEKIIIPTPALAELLIGAGDATPGYLEIINRSRFFRIVSFDMRAAIEVAASHREAIRVGDKKEGTEAPWQKVKYDRQIVAIAKVEGANRIYSNDQGIRKIAEHDGISVVSLDQLDTPPTDAQADFFPRGEADDL